MRTNWIVTRRVDLLCFVAPALSGYVLIYLNVDLGVSSFLLWWFWNVSVNGPHFFATISRTYLDREEWRQRGALLLGSLAFVLLGPAAIGVSLGLGSRAPFILFWLYQALWAYYHVVRQHYGFLALYQLRNGERVGKENGADYWLFNLIMFAPAVVWFLHYPELRHVLHLGAAAARIESLCVVVLYVSILFSGAAYVAKEVAVFTRTRQINVPKSLLVLAYVPLHLVVFLHPAVADKYDLLLMNAVVTYPHSVQYLGIVWFHNKNRYQVSSATHYGWAHHASRNLTRFLVAATLFSVLFFYAEWFLEARRAPFSFAYFQWSQLPLGQGFTVADLVAVTWLGFIFNHYYLDQKIWRIRTDRQLANDLRVTA